MGTVTGFQIGMVTDTMKGMMKGMLIIGLVIGVAVGLVGCSGIVEDDYPREQGRLPDDTLVYTVREVLEQWPQEATVVGYIVGCIKGTSISGAHFSPPFQSKTNLLVADRKDECDTGKCLPVELGTSPSNGRKDLNLMEHPELCQAKVIIHGKVEYYFKQIGLKGVNRYQVLPMDVTDVQRQDSSFSQGGFQIDVVGF